MNLKIKVFEAIKVFDILPFILKGYSSIKKIFTERVAPFFRKVVNKANFLRGPPITITIHIDRKEAQKE